MRYVAAVAAFVVAYLLVGFAYAELAPRAMGDYFRERPAMLGFILFLVSVIAAVAAFEIVG